MSQPRSTFFLWVRRILLGVLFLVVVGGIQMWWSLGRAAHQGEQDLRAALAETDALDPRWRWDDLEADRPAVADDENSFQVVLPVGEAIEKLGLQKFDMRSNGKGPLSDAEPNRLLDDVALEQLALILDGRDDLVAQAVTLADRPHGRYALQLQPEVISTLLPHVQPCREVAWLLAVDAERHLYQGRAWNAARNIHATLNCGAALRGEGFLISQLVRVALRAVAVRRVERLLGLSEPDDETLRRLQERLIEEAKERPILDGLRGERASATVLFENLRSGTVSVASFLANASDGGNREPGWDLQFGAWRYSYHLAGDHADLLRWLNRVVEVARLPLPEQQALLDGLDQEAKAARQALSGPQRGLLTFLLLPAALRTGEAGIRDQAHLATARTALAAERFRRAQQRWPATLDELVPTYLPEVPADPFTGQPLCYRVQPDGVVVYSVGKDGRDDGGVPMAAGPAVEPVGDLVLRLWDPPHRRLPPAEAANPIPEPHE